LIIGVDAGSGGSAKGRLTGTGQRFRFEVDRPGVFFAATSRPVLSAVAARMAEAGLSGEVHGPRGRVGGLDPNRPLGSARYSPAVPTSPLIRQRGAS